MAEELELEQIEIPEEPGDAEEIEIVDDAPANEKLAPVKLTPDDLSSDSIRKSINRLTRQRSEAMRVLGETQREKEAALDFAKRAHAQLKFEQAERIKAQTAWQREAAARRDADIRSNKGEFVTAREANDAGKEADVNAAIARLTSEKSQIEGWAPTAHPIPDIPEFTAPQQVPNEPNPETLAWAEANDWFIEPENSDMRAFAVAMESSLVQRGHKEGTKACYDALDAELRKAFPDRFDPAEKPSAPPPAAPARKAASPVIGAPRTNGNGTRPSNGKMTLTASEVAVAKALGVSLPAYWHQKQKDKQNG